MFEYSSHIFIRTLTSYRTASLWGFSVLREIILTKYVMHCLYSPNLIQSHQYEIDDETRHRYGQSRRGIIRYARTQAIFNETQYIGLILWTAHSELHSEE